MNTRKVHEAVLANGLKVLGEVIPSSQSAAMGFFVRTGSRDESAKESGVSHFLEHMVFKGTKRRSALDITFELGNLGAQANAFTSEEMTVYYAGGIPEMFRPIQELLSDMLRPAIASEDFATEKKVILEEIALYQDRPSFYLYEHALKDFFGTHPVGNSVLGSTESISALERDEMADYFQRRYSPSNIVLSAAGNFSWDQFLSDAEALTNSWSNFPVTRKLPDFSPVEQVKEYRKKDLKQGHVILMSRSCSAQDPMRYPLAVLSTILGDSTGSKLYWELIDTGIAESAGADNDERDGVGAFMASASTEPGRLDEVVSILRRVLSAPLDFTERELEQAKTKLKTKIVLGGELPMGRMMALGQEWSYRGRIHSLHEVMSQIQSVGRKDIEDALRAYPLNKWSEFRLIPA
jgi:predicted Zn-dependent peptidase